VRSALVLLAACTIDPIARAELAGDPTGDAIFQRAGTSTQVSYRLALTGSDGTFAASLDDGACGGDLVQWEAAGDITITAGSGELRGVSDRWDVASGDNAVVGRSVVLRRGADVTACAPIFNSD
jgi:hypothetical protein